MNTQYVQVAICGIAEDKTFNDAFGLPTKVIKRKKLADYICYTLHLNKLQFAKKLNVSAATVSKWLYTDTVPSIGVASHMAHMLNLTLEEVYKLFSDEAE